MSLHGKLFSISDKEGSKSFTYQLEFEIRKRQHIRPTRRLDGYLDSLRHYENFTSYI